MNGHNRLIFDQRADSEPLDLKTDAYSQERMRLREDFLKRYGSKSKALDLGCGGGEFSILASRYCNSVVGLDFSESSLRRAHKKIDPPGINKLKFIQADAVRLPFKDNIFDLVFSFSTLEYIRDLEAVLKEMHRLLRSDGVAIFDLGNVLSLNRVLNALCSDLQVFNLWPFKMERIIRRANFKLLEHRMFQLFPMYGGWWVPFSSEYWRRIFARKVNGRTIDEIISSLPFLRIFSFRHFFACKKL